MNFTLIMFQQFSIKPDFEIGGRGVTIHHIYPKQCLREMFVLSLPL
jgi:hypothetical protein